MKGEQNMKEIYTAPETEIIAFESEDVITDSILTGDDEMPIIG